MEAPTCQAKVRRNCIIEEGCDGSIIWITPSRARLLADAGAVDLIGERPSIGPSETKPAGPSEKKASAVDQVGPLTDSPRSIESGKAAPSSLSEGGQALDLSKSPQSKRPGLPKKST